MANKITLSGRTSVACPHCGAGVGMLCMFGRTAKHHEIHDARRRALFQARKLACLAGQWTNVAWAIHFADVRV